jgi:glucosyl-3-phosphoglycerate synthase
VWLAVGAALAGGAEFLVVHDADATTYGRAHVPRLLHPVANGFQFAKGYYARVENDRLYGRLCRLFYEPLVRALGDAHDEPVVEYLGAFRYALAGEFAATAEVARSMRAQPGWGLEVGTLGEAFAAAGFEGSAQVDLGIHEHDHRSVGGPDGLGDMCEEVGAALFRVLADHGADVDFDRLRDAYREHAYRLVDQYAADAAFNGLDYDRGAEREQVDTYAAGVAPPGDDRRLPAWRDAPLDPETVRERSAAAVEEQS